MRTILIIEDEKALLDSYENALKSDFSVLKAESGYTGLEILSKNVGKIDCVTLDLLMPGIDGLEVLKHIKEDKEKYGNMPIIVLSNMNSEKVIKEAFDLNAASYLLKSEIEYKDLIDEIKKVLGDM
ncbi:response regulator [Candidatus Dojkabacteria bacterium]|jgi:CheY-like chemotaxis protein|nr:response regulator [Candidatus Dojkabacteria bacterium]